MSTTYELFNADCLDAHNQIKSGSVDLILTDLPYGNMKNAPTGWDKAKTAWDNAVDPAAIFDIANRILRKNGRMVLFAQEPYTTELITGAIPNVPFSYRAIWKKDNFANALLAKKAMVSYFEDVLIFAKRHPKHDFEGLHPLREYFLSEKEKAKLSAGQIKAILGNQMGSHYFTLGDQFCIPTINNYEKLQKTGYFTRNWHELREIDAEFKREYPSTFNLWQGGKYKSNILEYAKDYDGHHPTQKPVELLEDLVQTYSNRGGLVVDLTMGSGSTGVACVNTGRRFVGIELDPEYFKIARARMDAAKIKELDNGNLFDYK